MVVSAWEIAIFFNVELPVNWAETMRTFEIHHIINDHLQDLCPITNAPSFIRARTTKSVGSDESQLLVHPTVGLNLPAR